MVVFHLSPQTLTGGYIGVDVFFVISGYLITGHLMREVERTGTVSMTEFWARRIRRLLPAALLVLAVSIPLTLWFVPGSLHQQNLTEIAFAGVYVLNWRLASDSVDYLAADNIPSIAQHYWSLSVEEQFYFVWPIVVMAVVWAGRRALRIKPRTSVTVGLVAIVFASFAYSIVQTAQSQPEAYFMTTTRAWEFALGGLTALLPSLKLSPVGWRVASWTAVAAILWSAVTFDASTHFPGWIASIPVAATAVLLMAGDSAHRWSPQFLAGWGPIQGIGDLSYSIYLWHWPLVVVHSWIVMDEPGPGSVTGLIGLTLLLAWATRRFVENPVRLAPGVLKRRGPTFALTVVAMALLVSTALTPVRVEHWRDEQYRQRVAQEVANPAGCFGAYALLNDCADPYAMTDTVNPRATALDGYLSTGPASTPACQRDMVLDKLEVTCSLASPASPTIRVALVGDSHVDPLAAPLEMVAQHLGWSLRTQRRSGCSTFAVPHTKARDPYCAVFGADLYSALAQDPTVDMVVVAIRSGLYTKGVDRQAAGERLRALTAAGKRVIVIRSVPETGSKLRGPACVERARGDDRCSRTMPFKRDWLAEVAVAEGIPVVDTWNLLCGDGRCHTVIGGTIVYFDVSHMATTFARTLAPWLETELVRVLS